MLKELLIEVITRLKYTKVKVISGDIDKNTVFPCFKIKLLEYKPSLASKNSVNYLVNLVVNYFPKNSVDNREELVKIQSDLGILFMFDIPKWITHESEIQDNEDFVSMTLNLERTCIYEENVILGENITIEEDIKEIIEEINLKEVIINDNTYNKH